MENLGPYKIMHNIGGVIKLGFGFIETIKINK
jgi:hypothetical protein